MQLEYISQLPKNGQPPNYVVIMLHGWGADARDLAPLAPMLTLDDCQFLFPNAPFPHYQAPNGRSWYALEQPDHKGLSESRTLLLDWLNSLEGLTKVPLKRTFLIGFSQGGAMTLDVGLQLPLAGLACLSGYLHSEPTVNTTPIPPVFIAHGNLDQVVPVRLAIGAKDALAQLKVNVELHTLEMGHEIIPEELILLKSFLKKAQQIIT